MNIKVVIGANFGDEGKGLMTDYLSSQCKNGIVVRFNGGGQAGHTVVTPDGYRHVFNHIGSGTLAGLHTYLSKDFIVNPIVFMNEYSDLQVFRPKVIIHPGCLVTTPFDMMINQIAEEVRGSKRHGSCGMGINETIERNTIDDFKIEYSDLGLSYNSLNSLKEKLLRIKNDYFPFRLKQLGIDSVPLDYFKAMCDNGVITAYLKDVQNMIELTKGSTTYGALSSYENVIFEGAQGLLLDQNNKEFFPNLTRSNTGLQNVVPIIRQLSNLLTSPVDIFYMTRAYMTRHGRGAFPTERLTGKIYPRIVDLTNVPNLFQESIRYGSLDMDLLQKSIQKDINFMYDGEKDLPYHVNLGVTCLDQVDDKFKFRVNRLDLEVSKESESFFNHLSVLYKFNHMYLSKGMTRETITKKY